MILYKETCLDEFQLMSYNYFIPASREYSFSVLVKFLVFGKVKKTLNFSGVTIRAAHYHRGIRRAV